MHEGWPTARSSDPAGLLTWHGANRASFAVNGMDALNRQSAALRAILSQWLGYV